MDNRMNHFLNFQIHLLVLTMRACPSTYILEMAKLGCNKSRIPQPFPGYLLTLCKANKQCGTVERAVFWNFMDP